MESSQWLRVKTRKSFSDGDNLSHNLAKIKEPAKRGSSAKVSYSDHMTPDSNTEHVGALVVEQKLHP